jgi:gliding motility-associated-like protein
VRVGEEIEGVSIGEHTLVLIDANQCKTIRRVTIHPPIIPDYELEGDTAGFDNGTLRFSVKPMGAEQKSIDSVVWYINGELFCSGPDCFNILLSNYPAGDYIHQIFIYYDDCYIEEQFGFVVKEIYRFFISNAIRPRAGNENSKWIIKTNDSALRIKDVAVFNRWGNLIFKKSDFNPNEEQFIWDGYFNGSPVAQDVYVYTIRYIDELGQEKLITGDITVFD